MVFLYSGERQEESGSGLVGLFSLISQLCGRGLCRLQDETLRRLQHPALAELDLIPGPPLCEAPGDVSGCTLRLLHLPRPLFLS